MPQVLNKYKHGIPAGAVYIGRPSKWGNPFVIGKDGDRDEVIAKYRAWLMSQPDLIAQARKELAGKDLVCFCAPKACHGDVLLEVANSSADAVDVCPECEEVAGHSPTEFPEAYDEPTWVCERCGCESPSSTWGKGSSPYTKGKRDGR